MKTTGIIVIFVLWILRHSLASKVETSSIERKPFGYKMCKTLCDIVDCIHQNFIKFTCNITLNKMSQEAKKHIVVYRVWEGKTKRNSFCKDSVNLWNAESTKTKPRSHRMNMKLVVAPVSDLKNADFVLLDLPHQASERKFRNLSAKGVTAIGSTTMYGLIYIATQDPNQIVAFSMETHEKCLLKDDIKTSGIAIDDEREFVFLATHKNKSGISRMNVKGDMYSSVRKTKCDMQSIALDTKRKIIFVSGGSKCNVNVFSVSYNGKDYNKMYYGAATTALAIDKTGKYLYLNRKNRILQVGVIRSRTVLIAKVQHRPNNLVFHKNTLYMSSDTSHFIYSISLTSKIPISFDVHYEPSSRICLISTPA